jgi:acetyl esterase
MSDAVRMGCMDSPSRILRSLLFLFVMAAAVSGKSFENIEYGNPSGYSLRLDARVPDGTGPFPAVIIVHGGAWVIGNRKRSVQPLFRPLEDADLAWFSIDYHLAEVDPASIATTGLAAIASARTAVDDIREAVSYVRTHAAEYRVDPNRIALLGESAGAQLASMAALKPRPGSGVQAVVAFYCPSDLANLIQDNKQIPDPIRRALEGSQLGNALYSALRELSPINWVRRDSPPFLLIHGTKDRLVPFQQSIEMRDALQKAGANGEVYSVPGGGHGVLWWEGADLTRYKQPMVRWLKEKLSQ